MRTVSRFVVSEDNIVLRENTNIEAAVLELILTLLREDRLVYPEDSRLVPIEVIRAAFQILVDRSSEGNLSTDPTSRDIGEAAAVALRTHIGHSPEVGEGSAATFVDFAQTIEGKELFDREMIERQFWALREAVALLAQVPAVNRASAVRNLKELIYDRDNELVGLLFQQGLTYYIRLRHQDGKTLKSACGKVVNACAPRAGWQLEETIKKTVHVDRISRRLIINFDPIEMRTPADEHAQTGTVHVVRSQFGLLWHLARQAPQIWLVWLTILLLTGDLLRKLEFVPDWTVRGHSLGDFTADFFGRLSTGAFGAYLVTLFIRFGEILNNLRGSPRANVKKAPRRTRLLRRGTYGAFIEWKTS